MAYLKLIRFRNLIIIALLQVLLRYELIIPILESYDLKPVLSDFRFGLLVLSTVLLAASGYIINEYFDVRIDRINRPESVVIGKTIKRRTALFLHVLLTCTGMLMGLYIAYVTRKENYALMFIGIPVMLWYYSTTFKRNILIGNLLIAMFTAIVALLVVSVEFAALSRVHGSQILESAACSTAWFWTSGFAFFAFITNFVREIIKDAEDVKGDKALGCSTLPIALGMPLTKLFVLILELASLLALWLIYFFVPPISSIPYALVYFIVGFSLPHILLMVYWMKADSPKQFHRVSTMGKLIMLAGVLFIILAGQVF